MVEGREPADYATCVASILDDPVGAARMATAAAERSWSYPWSAPAARLRRLCDAVFYFYVFFGVARAFWCVFSAALNVFWNVFLPLYIILILFNLNILR